MTDDQGSRRERFVASLRLYGWLVVAVVVLGFLGGILAAQYQARYGTTGQPSESPASLGSVDVPAT